MERNFKWKVLLVIAVLASSIYAVYPPAQKIHLGLDLKGGIHLLLQVETDKIPQEQREGAVDRAIQVIRNRIDEFGVREPTIIKQGTDHVVVQLPGVTDEDRARDIVSKTAHLEFKIVESDPKITADALKADSPQIPAGYEVKKIQGSAAEVSDTVVLKAEPVLTGDHLTNAAVGFDQYGQAIVQFELDKEGAKVFDDVTFKNIGNRLAIVLDGIVHSAPVIRDRIPSGQGQITGNFTPAQASDLALVLRAGALPAPVKVIEQHTVGPTLGRDSITQGIRASIGGAVLVLVFMAIYYGISGVIAGIAVLLNLVILAGFLAFSGASLTLPGIAGIILTMGMAVDANVLINERMREEKELGKAIRSIISAGYHKAFSAIFDSNLTTILAAAILLWFGTGPIRGFAITLIFGLIASLFAALFITRLMFDFLTRSKKDLKLRMMELIKNCQVDWMAKRKIGYTISMVLFAVGITMFFTHGHGSLGIDFTGGTLQEVHLTQPPEMGAIRSTLERAGVRNVQIQSYGGAADQNIVIRSKGESTQAIRQALDQAVGTGKYEIRRSDTVGPAAGKELFRKGIKSVILALVLMMVYVWYRYNFRFGMCAMLMVLHDLAISFGIFILSGREFSLTILAALLTIIGYSINDTIIVYDRMRENLKLMRKKKLSEVLNTSINQTLNRSILTTLTTVLVAISLFLFGGPALNDFSFILIIGFVLSVYSTIFVAAPLILETSKES
ncbi:MAG: protein translocase subunit SecDF [Candidatus Omnitrophica bacterium CG11_big_fil_rev_8_21_14_0_20_45_26]|uniref:Multifunctional fusion protein n=1 Tax=Candidatus Abzuiibacterium crystallinum TaxID=1974748 RepID=A0A2H0LSC0_9BACT|nr:MAG: protein translocase subunit SecDF [Candidatus Omnitrophica bacterium CG11_big_fil_rev_8_21_14_0_20_45_26]PIW64768.1 MAG: protein translocase subunit SecDF [Candidatus Omnitrophica bacterium CG12_big_fil_rev_8_21_14_0_65_45_16]